MNELTNKTEESIVELVETTVKVPKQILEFLQALQQFKRSPEDFAEFLGDLIVSMVAADFDCVLEPQINASTIAKHYGLLKIPDFKHLEEI